MFSVIDVLSDGAETILTRHETIDSPPNYFLRDLAGAGRSDRQVTAFTDPTPDLRGIHKEIVKYTRDDGVQLSATLYLPAGHVPGERLPLMVWAYPQEFNDPATAGQVSGSPYRFIRIEGSSHLFLLTQGYGILDNPTFPIIGEGETANDTYVEQLETSARAAIDTLVAMGVARCRNHLGHVARPGGICP